MKKMNKQHFILDFYSNQQPSVQAMVDVFNGEWSSTLPPVNGEIITSGQAGLFDDHVYVC